MTPFGEFGEAVASVVSGEPDRVLLHTGGGDRHRLRDLVEVAKDFITEAARHGAVRGSVVLLEFSRENWPLFLSAYVGCALAGFTPAVVSAESGQDRREALLHATAVHCVVSSGLPRRAAWHECEFSALGGDQEAVPDPRVAEYLVTSGTTGDPKVVAVGHEARLAPRVRRGDGDGPGVVALTVPPGTNAAQTAVAEALLRPGGGLACLEKWSPHGFVDLVESSRARCALLAPALAGLLVRAPRFEPERLRGLQLLRLGMAPAAPSLIEAIVERLPWVRLSNIYTSTEAWPAGTTMRYSRDAVESVGRPLPGTRVRIVDESGRRVPVGAPGRIQLAYVPLADRDGAGGEEAAWVDTGDRGLLDSEGQLFFTGRETDLVTAGGALVSYVAVEQAALATGLVRDAAALSVETEYGRRISLCVVWADEAREESLRELVRQRVGADAAPAVVHSVGTIPRDAQGKLRRMELEALARPSGGPATGDDRVAEGLRMIWCEVLMRSDVGLDDDFFKLGGDSLAVVMCNTLLEDRFDVLLPLTVHYEATTLRELAGHVGTRLTASADSASRE